MSTINVKRGTSLRERGHDIVTKNSPDVGIVYRSDRTDVTVTWFGPLPEREDRRKERVHIEMSLEEAENLVERLKDQIKMAREGWEASRTAGWEASRIAPRTAQGD
jgi:hypothetical protein